MKLIIAGTRTITDKALVKRAFARIAFVTTEIVSGGASGVDSIGEEIARKLDIPLKRFLADQEKYGNAAGPIRNKEMAEYADALLLIWDGKSKGSRNMLENAKRMELRVFEVIV